MLFRSRKLRNRVKGDERADMRLKEEVEQIDELSKHQLLRYIPHATRDVADHVAMGKEHQATMVHAAHAGNYDAAKKATDKSNTSFNKAFKRIKGVDRATRSLARKEIKTEEVQIDELSKGTLASYAKKAADDTALRARYDNRDQPSPTKKTIKRLLGTKKAIDKLAKEDVQIDELSKKTLDSYISRAKHHADWAETMKFMDHKQASDIIKKREAGIGHAINKKANHEYTKEEAEHIEEATVATRKYDWGTMKTVHHGAMFSIPLHPEHHQAIAKLKSGESHSFKDETGQIGRAHV